MEQGVDLADDVGPRVLRASRTDLHDPRQRTEVEAALGTLPGVVAARIVPGFEREVDELHVLTSLGRGAKQTVRDIQSTLMARFDITTDHRVISVVQLGEDDTPTAPTSRRILITAVTVTQQGLESTVEVVLSDGDGELVGHSTGPASTAGRWRAAGRATLAAILPLLAENRMVELEGAEVTEVLGRRVALALVHFHSVKGGWTVSGSAMVRDDESEAIARSVLDAVNRSLEELDR